MVPVFVVYPLISNDNSVTPVRSTVCDIPAVCTLFACPEMYGDRTAALPLNITDEVEPVVSGNQYAPLFEKSGLVKWFVVIVCDASANPTNTAEKRKIVSSMQIILRSRSKVIMIT